MQEPSLADKIAQACLREYARLPARGKPRVRTNGVPEWTVLAGFVLYDLQSDNDDMRVISLGTGLKCLPANRLPLHGDVLHDSHAEIIARRGLMLWLYHQLLAFHEAKNRDHQYLEQRGGATGGFRLQDRWRLCMYVSTLPCGDASMKLLAYMQDPLVAGAFENDAERSSTALSRGREAFNHTSALRTKPGRADSVTTASMSCSDKLASWSVLGVQGSLLAQLVEPLYISQYVFGHVPTDLWPEVHAECERALSGRLGHVTDLPVTYEQTTPLIAFVTAPFEHARHVACAAIETTEQSGCPESLSWVAGLGSEIISLGIKQGAKISITGPQAVKARSRISRICLLELFKRVRTAQKSTSSAAFASTYMAAKRQSEPYQAAKNALRGRIHAPFKAWVVNDERYQAFTTTS